MSYKSKTLALAIGIIVFVVACVVAYNILSDDARQNINVTKEQGELGENGSSGGASGGDEASKIAASDFTMQDSDGNDVKLSDMFGKPIVLNFWASWCPPCVNEMPIFDKVNEELGTQVQFVMVNLADGDRETVEFAKEFISYHKFTMPVFFDTTGEAATEYNIQFIPSTFFIDKDGNIVNTSQGEIDEETLRKGIAQIDK